LKVLAKESNSVMPVLIVHRRNRVWCRTSTSC